MNKTLRSIISILAGILTVVVLSIATDFVLESIGVFPSFEQQMKEGFFVPWMLLLALTYRSIYTVVGSYVTVSTAPDRPMRHAVIYGIIGVVLGTVGAIANWDKTSPGTQWYPIMLVALSLPCAWLGAKLKLRK